MVFILVTVYKLTGSLPMCGARPLFANFCVYSSLPLIGSLKLKITNFHF